VVVFDIDETLCAFIHGKTILAGCTTTHEINGLSDDLKTHFYSSIPHLDCVVKYLLSKSIRIAIFSAASETRNLKLSQAIFIHVLGNDYRKLTSVGQFRVFSKHHQISYKKDLSIVLREGEHLENCLLIDDNTDICKKGQENNFVLVPVNVIGFQNLAYYYLGLFKSYFDSDICETQSISQFMSEHIKMCKTGELEYCQRSNVSIQFALDMVKIGLKEVRNSVPNAAFYCYFERFGEKGDIFRRKKYNNFFICNPDAVLIDDKTGLRIICDEPYLLMKEEEAIKALKM
jgi:hypothetical protein